MFVLDGNNDVRCVVTSKGDFTRRRLFACYDFPTSWNGGIRLDGLISLPVDGIRLDCVTILVPVNDVSLLVVCCISDCDGGVVGLVSNRLTGNVAFTWCVARNGRNGKPIPFSGRPITIRDLSSHLVDRCLPGQVDSLRCGCLAGMRVEYLNGPGDGLVQTVRIDASWVALARVVR